MLYLHLTGTQADFQATVDDATGALDPDSCEVLWIQAEGMVRLPGPACNLVALRTLDLSCCINLKTLPEQLVELPLLACLKLKGCTSLTDLPSLLSKLSFLSELDLEVCAAMRSLPDLSGAPCLTRVETRQRELVENKAKDGVVYVYGMPTALVAGWKGREHAPGLQGLRKWARNPENHWKCEVTEAELEHAHQVIAETLHKMGLGAGSTQQSTNSSRPRSGNPIVQDSRVNTFQLDVEVRMSLHSVLHKKVL